MGAFLSSFISVLFKFAASAALIVSQPTLAGAQPDATTAPVPPEPHSTSGDDPAARLGTPLVEWTIRPTIVFAGDRAEPRTITSVGTCSLAIDADRARITVIVTGTSASPAEAVGTAQADAGAIRAEIGAVGVADLEIRANPVRTATDAVARFPSYTATIALEFVTSSIDRMGEVVDAVRVLGRGSVAEFERYVSDDRRRAAEGDCLAIASGNARARAERLASALGATVGLVLRITDETLPVPDPGVRTSKLTGTEALPLAATLDQLIVALSIVVEFALE